MGSLETIIAESRYLSFFMEAFNPIPPEWVEKATHASSFCCPRCSQPPSKAEAVWVNRRSPVYTENHQRKWQEFYKCECQAAWWAWSNGIVVIVPKVAIAKF